MSDADQTKVDKKLQQEELERQERLAKAYQEKVTLREQNLKAHLNRPDETVLKQLDSSLKRNTAFVKRIKMGAFDESKSSLCADIKALNLTRYITEVAASVIEAVPKMKAADVTAAVHVCCLLHQRYADFTPALVDSLKKQVAPIIEAGQAKKFDKSQVADAETQLRRRILLRLLGELYVVGIHDDLSLLCSVLIALCKDNLKGSSGLREATIRHPNLPIVLSLVRAMGTELMGIGNFDSSRPPIVGVDAQAKIRRVVTAYFEAVSATLLSEHEILKEIEKEYQKTLMTRGEADDASMADTQDKFRKLQTHVTSLATLLELPVPELVEENNGTRMTPADTVVIAEGGVTDSGESGVFDDAEERSFYEDLPDLKAILPAILFEGSNTAAQTPAITEESSVATADATTATPPAAPPAMSGPGVGTGEAEAEKTEVDKDDDLKDATSPVAILLGRLKDCVNRDLIDSFAVDFCYINNKGSRKKLVKGLFNIQRTQLDLIPLYARLVATLSLHFRDISENLLYLLEEELTFLQQKKKDQIQLEAKIKDIRFLSELVKFKVCPHNTIFTLLRSCLDEFTPHNIEIACSLLEVCGRFLYRSPATSVRMQNMLDIFSKLKQVKISDPRLETMAEGAIFACKPTKRAVKKARPPLQSYIRYLLHDVLNSSTIDFVTKKLRKLPWIESEVYVRKCFVRLHRMRFPAIQPTVRVLYNIARERKQLVVCIIDTLLETVRVDLEENDFRKQQQRLMAVAYLAEIYRFHLINTHVILDLLYQLITFGSDSPPTDKAHDPPQDTFRIRLVAAVLETCGDNFSRGSQKRKLDIFLVYFQRYCLQKEIGMDTSFLLADLYDRIRPSLRRFENIDEAKKEIDKIEEQGRSFATSQRSINTAPNANGSDDESDGELFADEPIEETVEEVVANEGSEVDRMDDGEDDDEEEYRRPQVHEEILFDSELMSMIQDSLKDARQPGKPPSHANMPLPPVPSGGESRDDESEETTAFRLLVRKGGRMGVKPLVVPRESNLAQVTMRRSEQDKSKQMELKRAVLDYEQREQLASGTAGPVAEPFTRPRGRGRGGRAILATSHMQYGNRSDGTASGHLPPGSGLRLLDSSTRDRY